MIHCTQHGFLENIETIFYAWIRAWAVDSVRRSSSFLALLVHVLATCQSL